MKRTVVKMHGILRVSNCSTKIGIEISDLMSAFSVRSEQFSNKTFHTGIQNPNGGPKIYGISSPKIFDEIFQKVFQMCNDSTAQTQRRAPTHRHGHRDLIRKHLLATQRIVVEISIARAFTCQTSLLMQEVVETLLSCHISESDAHCPNFAPDPCRGDAVCFCRRRAPVCPPCSSTWPAKKRKRL